MTAKPCKTMGRFTNFADVLSENCKFWPCLIYVTTLCICKSRYKYNVWPPWPAVCLFCSFLGSCCRCFFGGFSCGRRTHQQLSGLGVLPHLRTWLSTDRDFLSWVLRLDAIRGFDDVILECLVRSGLFDEFLWFFCKGKFGGVSRVWLS